MYIIVVFLCGVTFAMFTRLLATFFKTKEAASSCARSNQKHYVLGFFLALCEHCLCSQMRAQINMLHIENIHLTRIYGYEFGCIPH